MNFSAEKIPYDQTGSFSKIVLDYLGNAAALTSFYNYRPDFEGIKKAVSDRKNFPVNRALLVEMLQQQYKGVEKSIKLHANIDSLLSDDTFTVCTAHQPNIFTGHLYFIYKILHAIKLSDELNAAFPENKFVPVYYMGSEDADLAELGEVTVNGTHYQWQTVQQGAVGRMKIDKAFMQLIDAIEGQLSVEKFGKDVVKQIRSAYKEGTTIQQATFHFVHELFNEFGLVILLSDKREFKNEFAAIITKELEGQFSHAAVSQTVAAFPREYKVQAAGRDVNLFYLNEGSRERIEKNTGGFSVANTKMSFTKDALLAELENNAGHFSPNVILRPVFQEMILPDIAFIGGGGELAYWLELKNVFNAANAFFPVLLLRNSFAMLNKKTNENLQKFSLSHADIFKTEKQLLEELVKRSTGIKLDLDDEKEDLKQSYEKIKGAASLADTTLSSHVYALRTQALHRLEILEKKMLKAEKKKFEAQQRQIHKIKEHVFPGGILQERLNNVLEYLSIYGPKFLQVLYKNSAGFPDGFTLLSEED